MGNRTLISLFVSLSSITLSGCITLADLDAQGEKHAENAGLSILKDPCPDSEPRAAAVFLAKSLSTARLQGAVWQLPTGSDLEVGKALIAQASNRGGSAPQPRLAMTDKSVGALLGMNLQSFDGDLDLMSDEAAAMGESALSGEIAQVQQRAFGPSGDTTLRINRRSWQADAGRIFDATMNDGWSSAFAASLGKFVNAGGLSSLASGNLSAAQVELYRKTVHRFLVREYFKAYFRNGQIFAISLTTANLKAGLKERLKATITDPVLRAKVEKDIDDLSDDVIADLCGNKTDCLALGAIGETTFMTRAGKSYGFPGFTASVDPFGSKKLSLTKIDKDAFVGDLVRVLAEATGDFLYAVPGVPKSTACAGSQYLCSTDAESDYVKATIDYGDRGEAATNSAVGIAIRGGWLFSLNNEMLANGIQTFASVAVRKSVEKAVWSIKTHSCPAAAPIQPSYRRVSLAIS